MARLRRASIYDGDNLLLRDVMVDLEERDDKAGGYWGGTFELIHLRQSIDLGGSYELKFEDGRSGTIFIVALDESPEPIDPWVSFRGSGALS
jgi:hypothetical protein